MFYRQNLSSIYLRISILFVIVMLNVLCITPLTTRRVDVCSLHLHMLLNEFRSVISQQALSISTNKNENKNCAVLASSLRIAEGAIISLEDIVAAFNSDDIISQKTKYKIFEIQYKFINACNLLKDVKHIEPRHLKKLHNHFEQFDEFVKNYCLSARDFLCHAEVDICNKITKFNHILLSRLLNKNYLKSNFTDVFADYFFYRPFEFVCTHPFIIAGLLVVSGLLVRHFGYAEITNRNETVDVVQFRVRNQYRLDCGPHSLFNLSCLINGENEEQIRMLLANDAEFNRVQEISNNLFGTVDNLDDVHIEELLTNTFQFAQEKAQNITIINRHDLANINEIDLAVYDFHHHFIEKRNRFNNAEHSQAQYFLVNYHGHWNPFMFIKDRSARGGVRVLTAESLFNANITTHPAIALICRFLTNSQ
jgi:hypothetical protein